MRLTGVGVPFDQIFGAKKVRMALGFGGKDENLLDGAEDLEKESRIKGRYRIALPIGEENPQKAVG